MKILIIEDETLIRRSLCYVAKKRGYEVQTALTGEGGLEIWKNWKPHLVFLDLILSDQNGYDVIQKITPFSMAKVVLMSAHFQSEETITENGVDLFLEKPFENIYQTFDQVLSYFKKETKHGDPTLSI